MLVMRLRPIVIFGQIFQETVFSRAMVIQLCYISDKSPIAKRGNNGNSFLKIYIFIFAN